jgi:hypothetical protein
MLIAYYILKLNKETIMAKFKSISGSFDEMISQIKKLVEEGNARRLIVKNKKGKTVLEVPLSLGLAGGTVAGVMAPVLSGLAAIALFINDMQISVERYDEVPDAEEADVIEVVDENEEKAKESENVKKASKKKSKAKDADKSDEN